MEKETQSTNKAEEQKLKVYGQIKLDIDAIDYDLFLAVLRAMNQITAQIEGCTYLSNFDVRNKTDKAEEQKIKVSGKIFLDINAVDYDLFWAVLRTMNQITTQIEGCTYSSDFDVRNKTDKE